MSLCFKTVRNIIDRLGGDAVRLATSESSEDEHMTELMSIVNHLEDRARYEGAVEMRKKLIRTVILSDMHSTAKADLVEKIFEINLPEIEWLYK